MFKYQIHKFAIVRLSFVKRKAGRIFSIRENIYEGFCGIVGFGFEDV